jgi:phage-related baseplate assembly protein
VTLEFLNTDTKTILAELTAAFEAESGRVLYPSQVENLLLHVQAYREALLRQDVQHSAEQNLIAYAIGRHLDELGANKDMPRIQPRAAECRVRFKLDDADPQGRSFPVGTRLTTADKSVAFETTGLCHVLRGDEVSTEGSARCTVPGTGGNGLKVGVVCCIDPPQPGVSVSNVTATEGGCDLELDGDFRERLKLSSARFGGGTAAAYRLQALSVSGLVADALAVRAETAGAVEDAKRGDILIYILPKDADLKAEAGLPRELLDLVEDRCNQDTVRMIGDRVYARYAERRTYAIEAELTVFEGQDADIVKDRVTSLAHEFAKGHSAKLGADVTPTQVMLALAPAREGLYSVKLKQPSEIVVVDANEWADAVSIDVSLAGIAHE